MPVSIQNTALQVVPDYQLRAGSRFVSDSSQPLMGLSLVGRDSFEPGIANESSWKIAASPPEIYRLPEPPLSLS